MQYKIRLCLGEKKSNFEIYVDRYEVNWLKCKALNAKMDVVSKPLVSVKPRNYVQYVVGLLFTLPFYFRIGCLRFVDGSWIKKTNLQDTDRNQSVSIRYCIPVFNYLERKIYKLLHYRIRYLINRNIKLIELHLNGISYDNSRCAFYFKKLDFIVHL